MNFQNPRLSTLQTAAAGEKEWSPRAVLVSEGIGVLGFGNKKIKRKN